MSAQDLLLAMLTTIRLYANVHQELLVMPIAAMDPVNQVRSFGFNFFAYS